VRTATLQVHVNVLKVAPTWTVNPADYEHSMTVRAKVFVGADSSTSTQDVLAAFVGDQVRGVAHPQLVSDGWRYFITVYGKPPAFERIRFKMWDSRTSKTYVATAGRHRVVVPDGGTEPIGRRIIQIPEDVFRTTIRDPHSPFLAYVPPGSIARGAALVKTGGSGKTISCAICHGDSLTGLGEVPRIAGLQPVYIARQLITIQNGSSAGTAVALMKKAVANLSEDDIISISAYLGSLSPQ